MLYRHFDRKCYILIDEYDGPINFVYTKFGSGSKELDNILIIFRSMFEDALKGNPYLNRGVMTGILRIAKANLFSGLNNVSEYTLLDKQFSKCYGFIQEEVDELLAKVPTETAPEKIKNWYNGYTFCGEIIYNPWSIMRCLASGGVLDNYWIDSGGTGLVDKALISDDIQEDIQNILEGNKVSKKLYKQVSLSEFENKQDLFFSLLVFSGYLNPELANDDEDDLKYKLSIPNKEVRNIYLDRVIDWVSNKLNIGSNDYEDFVGLLTSQKLDRFKERFSEYLMNSTSYHDLTKEKDYHNLMGSILAPLSRKYIIESNKESGLGRLDHMLIPIQGKGDVAMIIEYKISKNKEELASVAQAGLNQIINSQYHAKAAAYSHVNKIVSIGIAFCGKELEMQYQIDDIV